MPVETDFRRTSVDRARRSADAVRTSEAANVQRTTAPASATAGDRVAAPERAEVDPVRQADARRVTVDGSEQARALQGSLVAATPAPSGPNLPAGYESLERLAKQLIRLDGRFSPTTAKGRSALAMALAIGGTEVYGQGTTGSDFFTRRGGTGNNMRGFAQMNLAYHRKETATPERYTRLVADMLTGQKVMPNSAPASDHVSALNDAVAAGTVQNGADLRRFMDRRGFGGSNWQGIDDGWSRVPGLADALVDFIRRGNPAMPNS